MLKDIYFFSPTKLAERIRAGEIGRIIELKHFIIFSIFFYSGFSLPIIIESEVSGLKEWSLFLLIFVTEAAINYFGILYTYQINQKGDGQNYLGRLFCLALPVSIRLSIYSLLIYLVICALLFVTSDWGTNFSESIATTLYFVGPCLYSIAFYLFVGKYIRACSNS